MIKKHQPLMEALGLAEVTHNPKGGKMKAK